MVSDLPHKDGDPSTLSQSRWKLSLETAPRIQQTWTSGRAGPCSEVQLHTNREAKGFTVSGLKRGMVSHQGGLSSCVLSPGWTFVNMISHQGNLSSRWSLSRVVFHQGGLSSRRSLIMVVFHQYDLSAGWSFVKVISIWVVCHHGVLSLGVALFPRDVTLGQH